MADENTDLAEILRNCLQQHVPEQWDTFVRLTQQVILQSIRRTLAKYCIDSRSVAEDLVQDIFVKLYDQDKRVLRSFRGSDSASLNAFLRTIAASVATDFVISSHLRKRGGGVGHLSLDDPDNNLVARDDSPALQIDQNLLLEQVARCLDGAKDRDVQVFWLHHKFGFSPQAIAAFPGIGLRKDGVEMLLYRLTRKVRDCAKKGATFRIASEGVGR